MLVVSMRVDCCGPICILFLHQLLSVLMISRGIPMFLINFFSKNKKNIIFFFKWKFSFFTTSKISVYCMGVFS